MAAADPDLRRLIGLRIAELRVARGQTQEEVSLRAGINRTAVGQLERGERIPRADTLIRIAGALGVDAGEMLTKLAWTPITLNGGGFHVVPEKSRLEREAS